MAIESQNIGDALVYLADKLGVATTEIMKIYAKVQFAFGILMIIESLTFIIGMLLLSKWVWINWDKDDNGSLIIKAGVIGFIITMLPFMIDIIGAGILRCFYPDYYAVESLIRHITQ